MTARADDLAAAVAAAAERERAGQALGAVADVLRRALDAARVASVDEFARGDVAAERLSAAVDKTLMALFAAGAARHEDAAGRLAIVAVGGYGRGRLAPYSDIDLLFLTTGKDEVTRPLLDFMLYPLWDAGLKLGHSVHTPASAIVGARKDLVARTAFLNARFVCGAKSAFADFGRRFAGLRLTTKKSFREAKLKELTARHDKHERAALLAEPDLKEGRGGLRDLHTLAWIHEYEFDRALTDQRGSRLFSREDVAAYARAERLLWSFRMQLHGLRGRADDALIFDVQPSLADRLGYVDGVGLTAVERMMKDYFRNAIEVGRLARLFRARLDEAEERLTPRALQSLPKSLAADEVSAKANLKLSVGRLTFDNARRARARPSDVFALFRAYARRPDFDIHPDALSIAAAVAAALPPEARNDADVAKLFLATLAPAADPAAALRLMAETGLLGRYIPAFGKIIGRVEYGLYRRYSLDEGVFQALDVLSDIEKGRARDLHPIATKILTAATDTTPFFVAVLLHEAGASLRDPTPEGAERLIARILARLGLEETIADDIAWTAARPQHLVRAAVHRDLADPGLIERFATEVGGQRRLDLLLVLAVAHLRMVNLGAWDDWRRRQITELYEAASAYFSGGVNALRERKHARETRARAAIAAELGKAAAATLEQFPDEIFTTFSADLISRVVDLARAAAGEPAVALQAREDALEAIVYAADRSGLLADLSGAISAAGAHVRAVRAMTTADGAAIDIFDLYWTPEAGGGAEAVARLHARLLAAARARPSERPQAARRIGDRRAIFHIPAHVAADPLASRTALVIDAEGKDRPGLLFALTSALADLDLVIRSAHVATYGARAVDAFYVTEADGAVPAGAKRLAAIEKRLETVLSSGETAKSSVTLAPKS